MSEREIAGWTLGGEGVEVGISGKEEHSEETQVWHGGDNKECQWSVGFVGWCGRWVTGVSKAPLQSSSRAAKNWTLTGGSAPVTPSYVVSEFCKGSQEP